MPRPFPGIDPYVEDQRYWEDFHLRFINYCCEAIADRLPAGYEARIDERLRLVEVPRATSTQFRPDVALVQRATAPARPGIGPGVMVDEPVTIPFQELDEAREVSIEVFRRPGRELVAVLELLSPTNKETAGLGEYLAKRQALYRRPVHLIELDLLVGGHRLPMGRPLPPGEFYALVTRSDRQPDSEVYAWSIRQPLPTIAFPLRAPDPDVALDLAAVYATAHARGRYDQSIDYAAPLSLPLAADDRAWAEAITRTDAR